jgi:hypothetical protein
MSLEYCAVEEGTRGKRVGLRKESFIVRMSGDDLTK